MSTELNGYQPEHHNEEIPDSATLNSQESSLDEPADHPIESPDTQKPHRVFSRRNLIKGAFAAVGLGTVALATKNHQAIKDWSDAQATREAQEKATTQAHHEEATATQEAHMADLHAEIERKLAEAGLASLVQFVAIKREKTTNYWIGKNEYQVDIYFQIPGQDQVHQFSIDDAGTLNIELSSGQQTIQFDFDKDKMIEHNQVPDSLDNQPENYARYVVGATLMVNDDTYQQCVNDNIIQSSETN